MLGRWPAAFVSFNVRERCICTLFGVERAVFGISSYAEVLQQSGRG